MSAGHVTTIAAALVALLSLIAVTAAQRPCCAPRQFEGLTSIHFSPNSTYREAFSSVSYDFTNQVSSSNETLIGSRGEATRQHVLVNGTSRTLYIVDHHSRECRIIALSQGMEPPCVPSHFRPEGTFSFGAGKESLSFNSFRGHLEGGIEAIIATTQATCIPISQVVHGERIREIQSFVNITLGIRDRRVFNVPPECRRAGIPIVSRTLDQLKAIVPLLKNIFLGHFF